MIRRRGLRVLFSIASLLGLVLPIAAARGAVPALAAGPSAVFTVGAAMRTVAPAGASMKTHFGGYGDCNGCGQSGGSTKVRSGDEFTVRAMYISDGKTANVLVSEPAEGWFAGYQEGSRLGITELRQEAAAALTAPGNPGGLPPGSMTQANLIVSTIHCHSCPTLVGIWGPTNVTYLHYVYDQTLAAIKDAQMSARAAHLTWATADIGFTDDVTEGQSNANEGWPVDGQLSVLQGRAVSNDAVIGTYMNVPTHGNIVLGPDHTEMDDEHFGSAARWLESHMGGVGVVAAGGLGDQTSPMQGDSTYLKNDPRGIPDGKGGYPRAYDVIDRLGALTGSTAMEALLHHGHQITSTTLKAAEQYQLIPANNPVVILLQYGGLTCSLGLPTQAHPNGGACQVPVVNTYPVDRSYTPPYAVGNLFGVWFTTLRIGDIAIASEPGEAFPHVSFAIRQAISGASAVFTPGNAQDQLGYYYEYWAYPGTFYYSADHYLFNVGATLAEQNIQSDFLNGAQLGFSVTPATAGITNAATNDYLRYFLKGGVQLTAYPRGAAELPASGSGITIPIGIYFNHARGSEQQCAPGVGQLCAPGVPGAEVNTGPAVVSVDGHPIGYTVTDSGGSYALVTFPCPGDYMLTATLPGTSAHWRDQVHVYSATMVTNTSYYEEGSNTGPHPLAPQNQDELRRDGVAGCGGYNPSAGGGGGLPNTAALVAGVATPRGLLFVALACLLVVGGTLFRLRRAAPPGDIPGPAGQPQPRQ